MTNPRIAVIGSSNTDMVIKSDKLPRPSETVIGNEFLMNPGGKGANQAVAAARLGGEVSFVAKTGDDVFGEKARQHYREEGIITDFIALDRQRSSGIALIMVDGNGENCISVASGANATLNQQDIEKAREEIDKSDVILMQLEIPLPIVKYVIKTKKAGNRVILNPAPAQKLDDKLLGGIYVLTPNSSEAEMLTGMQINSIDSARTAANILKDKGVENVIITLGKKGAFVLSDHISELVPAPAVSAVDSTAAGDTFNGALAVALANGESLIEATKFANQAASLSVKKMGAQVSIPYRAEIITNNI
ncbi:MAG TPA: ribokinase [Balneolaceae bacterium]|nr:ribokinase [Balneolaceae bacterium]